MGWALVGRGAHRRWSERAKSQGAGRGPTGRDRVPRQRSEGHSKVMAGCLGVAWRAVETWGSECWDLTLVEGAGKGTD